MPNVAVVQEYSGCVDFNRVRSWKKRTAQPWRLLNADGLIRGTSAGARASVTVRSLAPLQEVPNETAFAGDIVLF
jgi:hypothetical protein